jgi:hypothetical protein
MTEPIGFIIISHTNPSQVLRLVRCLSRIYDNPLIVCHHDFSQSSLPLAEFPQSAQFIFPHIKTRWAQFSVVSATLLALDLLYQKAAPKWFVLLSGADYPTMPASEVLRDLESRGVDALLDYREVTKPPLDVASPENPALRPFASRGNLELAWHRYVGMNPWVPIIRKGPRLGRHTFYLPFEAWSSPFGSQFKCFYGDHWFSGNQKVAELLLNPTPKHLQLRRHLRLRTSPDECYYHTVIANAPNLKLSTGTSRFCNWTGGKEGHPRDLGLDDLPAIISSNAHFARKFTPGSPVLDEIDKILAS